MALANNPPRSLQTGVGLIEILVTVLVLSIGFLGVAALQSRALSNNNSSLMRTQASIAAYAMFDAMRADRANALLGVYNGTVTAGSCPTTNATLAQLQISNWCFGFDTQNPPTSPPEVSPAITYSTSTPPPPSLLGGLAALGTGTQGVIACVGTAVANNCSITFTFDDSKSSAGSATQGLVFWTQL